MILRTAYITLFTCAAVVFNLLFTNLVAANTCSNSDAAKIIAGSAYQENDASRRFVSADTPRSNSGEQIIAEDTEESGDDFIKKLKLFLGMALFVFSFGRFFTLFEESATVTFRSGTPQTSNKKYLAVSVLRI